MSPNLEASTNPSPLNPISRPTTSPAGSFDLAMHDELVSALHETEAASVNSAGLSAVNSPDDFARLTECPFCSAPLAGFTFSCGSCRAALSLSDIDKLLACPTVNRDAVLDAVSALEGDWGTRDFRRSEMITLGVGHMNLGNFQKGLAYLNEALRLNHADVVLAGQITALAIRIDEIQRQAASAVPTLMGRTILVVDDSATVRKLLTSKLEKAGHAVICAADGIEAMSLLDQVSPDLILLDITMPKMDGYQTCKLMRADARLTDVPVIMISGNDGFFDKVRGKMAGATDYITKPFGPETLMKALDTYLSPADTETD